MSPWRKQRAIQQAHELMPSLAIGYVVADARITSPELLEFARMAFDLTAIAADGDYILYRTPLAPPLAPAPAPPKIQ